MRELSLKALDSHYQHSGRYLVVEDDVDHCHFVICDKELPFFEHRFDLVAYVIEEVVLRLFNLLS